jgi:phosphatidate cytidylyltransferase
MKRVLTAVLLIPVFGYVILWGPQWLFLVALTVVALLCFREYAGIVKAQGFAGPGIFGYTAGLLLLLLPMPKEAAPATLVALLALALALRQENLSRVLPSAGALIFGLAYVFGTWRCAIGLRAISPYWLLFALAVNWVGDSAAYFGGRAFGRRRLAPRISPAKTVEGSVCAVAASVLFGAVFLPWSIAGVTLGQAVGVSVAANVAGQVGDLAESALKRGAGVKDSGTMLPGHGGWLDRVDSSLFTMPVVYLLSLGGGLY